MIPLEDQDLPHGLDDLYQSVQALEFKVKDLEKQIQMIWNALRRLE